MWLGPVSPRAPGRRVSWRTTEGCPSGAWGQRVEPGTPWVQLTQHRARLAELHSSGHPHVAACLPWVPSDTNPEARTGLRIWAGPIAPPASRVAEGHHRLERARGPSGSEAVRARRQWEPRPGFQQGGPSLVTPPGAAACRCMASGDARAGRPLGLLWGPGHASRLMPGAQGVRVLPGPSLVGEGQLHGTPGLRLLSARAPGSGAARCCVSALPSRVQGAGWGAGCGERHPAWSPVQNSTHRKLLRG